MKQMLALMATCALAGCGTAYSSARLESSGEARPLEIFGVIEGREFAKHVQVRLPASVVVADVCASGDGRRDVETDKRSVQLIDALSADRSSFADVSPLFTDAGQLAAVRTAAARQHADLLVVTAMSERVRDDGNTLGIFGRLLNLLVLPNFVVPSESDKLTLSVRAAVIDVRNDLVYATFQDHREEDVHATLVGERDAIDAAFDRLYGASLEKMRTRVVERLKTLEQGTD